MQIQYTEGNEEYEKVLIRAIWAAWKQRPPSYTDASGVTMSMSIDSFFKNTGVEEPDEIKKNELSFSEGRYIDLEFYDDGFGSRRHRIRLSEQKVITLLSILSNFLPTK